MRRRQFLAGAAKTTVLSTTVLAARAAPGGRVIGANDRVRLGLIGCGGRGFYVADYMLQLPHVEFTAACDVWDERRARAAVRLGAQCKTFGDFRRLLDQKDVDAVLVATPDHWHAIPTVLACQAGKDVYVEKPLAHNVKEGRAMVDAARRNGRVVQVGTQQRSAPHFERAREMIRSGKLGEVRYVRIWNFANRTPDGIGRKPDSEAPPGVDWDMYLGPAPWVPFNRNRFASTYRYFWDYAGGKITDWGVHRLDSMHQVMGVDAPKTVSAAGGLFTLDDGREVPDMLQVTYEYPGFVVSYEACELNAHGLGGRSPNMKYYHANGPDDRPHGLAFYGTNGALFADRLGFEVYPDLRPGMRAAGRDSTGCFRMERQEAFTGDSVAEHAADFIRCVRTRERGVADVLIGHRSTIAAHLGNIAYKTGSKIRWDAQKEEIPDDRKASQLLSRQARKPWDLI